MCLLDLSLVRVGRQWRNSEVYRTACCRTIPKCVTAKFDPFQVTVCSLRPTERYVGDELVGAAVVLDRDLHFLARDRTVRDCQGADAGCRCRCRARAHARARLCRRVMQRNRVRRDAPLVGIAREGVRRRVEVSDIIVAEVEPERGQVRRLEGHKEHVLEVPAINVGRVLRTSRDGTTHGVVLWVVVRGRPTVRNRQRVSNPLRHAVLDDAVGVSGQAAIDRRRVDQQVGAVGARRADRLDATREVRRHRPGRGRAPHRRSIQVSCNRGIPRDLGSVVHQRRCAVDDNAAVTTEGTERPVAGRRRIKCRCRDVVDVEAHRDRAVRPQDLEAGLVTAGQVAERVPCSASRRRWCRSCCRWAPGTGCMRSRCRSDRYLLGLLRSFRPGTASLLACLLV